MDDSIDLRPFLSIFVRRWRLITGVMVGSALVALIVSLLVPPTYEATALVIATKPLYQLQFDPRIANTSDTDQISPNKALSQLALTDELIQPLYDRFRDQLDQSIMTLDDFKRNLNARAGADPSLIQLSVRGKDSQLASFVSNLWATRYITYVNELYQQREAGLTFFEAQANEANLKLANAEQALTDYQSRYEGNIINSQLQADIAELSSALRARTSLNTITANIGLLLERLAALPDATPANGADGLSGLLLQISSLDAGVAASLQLQLPDSVTSIGKTVGEQKAALTGLRTSLQARLQQVDERISALQPQIRALQHDLQASSTELDRLTRDRDIARETYLTLTKKVNETQISASDTSGQVRLASMASVPTEPVWPQKVTITVLGAILGFVMSVGGVTLNRLRTKDSAFPTSPQPNNPSRG